MKDLLESLNERTYIIAEIGCNHNGDMAVARELVRVAAEAGADAAKFQSFNPEEMSTENAPKALYQTRATGVAETQFQRLKRLRLSEDQHIELQQFCRRHEIEFCSSPFDHRSVELLKEMDVPFFKVPSGEITNLPLLEHIGSCGKPVILSTGMSTLGEIETAVSAIGTHHRRDIILLHCVSDYPARWEDANLRAIATLREAFGLPVGFSDHTEGIELPLVAVALGAVVVEKHITLSRAMEGGDHKASLEPAEFREMVAKIRRIRAALGDGMKRCMPAEENIRSVARKSIVAVRRIIKGDLITRDALATKRPGTGLPPTFLNEIVGARAREEIAAGEAIRWSQLEFTDK